MIVQAAKIIGSGLATIGLTDILLSVIRNEDMLISKIIKTELIEKGISTVNSMIESLPKNSILYKFLEIEIKGSKLYIRGGTSNIKGYVKTKNFLSLPLQVKSKIKIDYMKEDFYIAGVYVLSAPDGEEYV